MAGYSLRYDLENCLTAKAAECDDFEQFLMMEYANENLASGSERDREQADGRCRKMPRLSRRIAFWLLCAKFIEKPVAEIAAEIIEDHLLRNSDQA